MLSGRANRGGLLVAETAWQHGGAEVDGGFVDVGTKVFAAGVVNAHGGFAVAVVAVADHN